MPKGERLHSLPGNGDGSPIVPGLHAYQAYLSNLDALRHQLGLDGAELAPMMVNGFKIPLIPAEKCGADERGFHATLYNLTALLPDFNPMDCEWLCQDIQQNRS